MAEYQGKFQYLSADGASTQEGACRIRFDAQTFTLSPQTGASLVFDLGDLDAVTTADYEIRLPLYTGRVIVLRQLGKAFDTLAHDLTEAFRNRTVQCLLLEDMGELVRFSGNVELTGVSPSSGPADIRLYKSNLAVLPAAARSFQWRLADIDEVKLDTSAYEVVLRSGDEQLKITRLAKRTEEFATKVQEAVNELATQSTQALHLMFPFLDPDQLQTCAGMLREGQSAPLAKLAAVHKQIPVALTANAVDKDLKPYYDLLATRAGAGGAYAGFKLIRPEDGDKSANPSADSTDPTDADDPMLDADATGPETLYWFFFPLAIQSGKAASVVAWEASSKSGRATYFFRLPAQPIDSAIRRLNRVLAMLNFRRRPIYLSDEELAMDPRFHRYAIAARCLAEVREVRASFLGRALHSSPEAWQQQMEGLLSKA